MSQPEAFEVHIRQADIDDLHDRLDRVRWPVDPGNPGGVYGAPRSFIEPLVHHWRHVYDWRAVEAEMNRYEHDRVLIDGVPIHYMRVPGKGPDPTPLILTHGWPWTFWDLHEVVDKLADPASHGGDPNQSFDVIVPSLPGYGLSVPLTTTGIDVPRIAELWVKLMVDVLGFERFGAQGGDWGAFVTGQLGHAHAEHLIGVYLTLPVIPGVIGRNAPTADQFGPDEQWMLERAKEIAPKVESHVSVHRRDPQTFAYAMSDSPVGMAAWIWWRRQLWCDGDALEVFGADDLCTLASLYWFHGSFASAIRLYAEQFRGPQVMAHDRSPIIEAPTGFGIFPKELMFVPRSVAERHTNLHRWTVFEQGGHFGPAERPDDVVDELRAFFADLR